MSEPSVIIDLEARKKADAAKDAATKATHDNALIGAQLKTHLENCERRYDQADKRHEDLVDDIKEGFSKQSTSTSRLHGRIDKILYSVVVGVVAIIAQIVLTKVGLL